jgi:hypothetical protein
LVAIAVVAVACLLLFAFSPLSYFTWNLGDLESVLINQVGMGASAAAVVAVPFAFLYALCIPLLFRWSFFGRRHSRHWALTFVAVFVIFASKPLIRAIALTPFSASGLAQKCYVWRDSRIVLFERSGAGCNIDPQTGRRTLQITPEIADLYRRQQGHVQPKLISADARTISFFDTATGQPIVWFSRGEDNELRLFDGPGFDADTGQPLIPVNSEVVREAKRNAAANSSAAAAASEAIAAAKLAATNPSLPAPGTAASEPREGDAQTADQVAQPVAVSLPATRYNCSFMPAASRNSGMVSGSMSMTIDEARECINGRTVYFRTSNGVLTRIMLVDRESRISLLSFSPDRSQFHRVDITLDPYRYGQARSGSGPFIDASCPAPGDSASRTTVQASLSSAFRAVDATVPNMDAARVMTWRCEAR